MILNYISWCGWVTFKHGPQILNDCSPKAVAGLFIELFVRVCMFFFFVSSLIWWERLLCIETYNTIPAWVVYMYHLFIDYCSIVCCIFMVCVCVFVCTIFNAPQKNGDGKSSAEVTLVQIDRETPITLRQVRVKWTNKHN